MRGLVTSLQSAGARSRTAWYKSQYRDTPRHTIEEEHVRYLTDLRATLKADAGRVGQARAD